LFVFAQENQVAAVMALIRLWHEAAILAVTYERKSVNEVVPVRRIFITAYPRCVSLDILVAVRTLNANSPRVQEKKEQTKHECQGD
jgi:hypothetical protein